MKIDFYKYIQTNKFIAHGLLMGLGNNADLLNDKLLFPVIEKGEEKGKYKPIDVKMTFNGFEVDVVEFFEHMEKEYTRCVEETAKGLFKERANEVMDKMNDVFIKIEDYADFLSEQIDWSYKE